MFLLSNSLVIDLLPLVEYLFDQGQKPFRHWSKEGVSKFSPSFSMPKAPTFTSWGFVIT